jgi:hypothetical protein
MKGPGRWHGFQMENKISYTREAHILNIARLITQEVSLMKDPQNLREAYNRQTKVLRDVFQENEGKPAKDKKKKGGR